MWRIKKKKKKKEVFRNAKLLDVSSTFLEPVFTMQSKVNA